MAGYQIKIRYVDTPDPLNIPLPDLDRDQAEAAVEKLRYDIGEAKNVEAPAVELGMDLPGNTEVIDPRRVREVDLVDTGDDD